MRQRKMATLAFTLALTAACATTVAQAQAVTLQPAKSGPIPTARERADRAEASETRAFFLKNATSQAEQNEILTALRQMLSPVDKVFVVPSARSIILRADADDLALAQRLIEEMDRPVKSYRLFYTFLEKEGGKTLGQQHLSVMMTGGQRTQVKGGNRVPIMTAAPSTTDAGSSPTVAYIDVGVNVDVTGDETTNGLRLRNKIERSMAAEERSTAAVGGDPIIRQSVIESTILAPLTKPVIVGTLDVPGSPRTLEVSVTAELVK